MRCQRVFVHQRILLAIPPVLNLPYEWWFIARFYLRELRGGCKACLCTVGAAAMWPTPLCHSASFWSLALQVLGQDDHIRSGLDEAKGHGKFKDNIERESKVYVERFLDAERAGQLTSLESTSRQSLDKLVDLQSAAQLRKEEAFSVHRTTQTLVCNCCKRCHQCGGRWMRSLRKSSKRSLASPTSSTLFPNRLLREEREKEGRPLLAAGEGLARLVLVSPNRPRRAAWRKIEA